MTGLNIVGKVTYKCATCGELISDDSELVFANGTYIGSTAPEPLTPDTRTHHIRCIIPTPKED